MFLKNPSEASKVATSVKFFNVEQTLACFPHQNFEIQFFSTVFNTYGTKCVGRIVTKSMSNFFNFWRLIVGDCDYAESYGWFLFGGNTNASHTV